MGSGLHCFDKPFILECKVIGMFDELGFHVDLAAFKCELDRIRDQVQDDLLQPVLVGADLVVGDRITVFALWCPKEFKVLIL